MSVSNPDGARRIISNLRNKDNTASHSNFLSHNSRRERADAPACAAAAACKAALLLGSLGFAPSDAYDVKLLNIERKSRRCGHVRYSPRIQWPVSDKQVNILPHTHHPKVY
jgi:hypothetical protein